MSEKDHDIGKIGGKGGIGGMLICVCFAKAYMLLNGADGMYVSRSYENHTPDGQRMGYLLSEHFVTLLRHRR